MQTDPIVRGYYVSPLGSLEITQIDDAIVEVRFVDKEKIGSPSSLLIECIRQLEEYFSGKRKDFSLPLSPIGTEFQKQVWQELQNILIGETRSYLDIALKLGDRNLTRAVGAANGKNPIAIIIPCHRVIGENRKLTGYAGGLWRKEWLLDFESKKEQGELFKR